MLRLVISLCLVLITTPAAAHLVEREALRDAAYAGQVDRAQAELLAGRATAGDMRHLFRVFTTTHPDMIAFTRSWAEQHPTSPYARISLAWVEYNLSWHIRGKYTADLTYPDAISIFNDMQARAWTHAAFAYNAAPRLIPASDAVIKWASHLRGS